MASNLASCGHTLVIANKNGLRVESLCNTTANTTYI